MLTRLFPATLLALAFAFACNSTDSGDDLGDLAGARDTVGGDLRLDTGLGDQPMDLLGDVVPGDAQDAGGDVVLNTIGGTSNCCTEHPTPGCSDPAAQSQVCMAYTHCCNTTWDMMCVMFAQNANLCQPAGPTCGDATCTLPSENCSTCPADCVCIAPSTCYINTCCNPNCAGKDCGDNGCGGTCGACAQGSSCVVGTCTPDCTPSCAGKDCGDNGCGGSCGTCADQNPCTDDLCSGAFKCQFLNDDVNTCDDGDACTLSDFCDSGTCRGTGLDPACALAVDLGAPLGVMSFPVALGGGCFQGSKAFGSEAGLPFALLNGKACMDGDVVVSVELWADASFGKLGGATLAGVWEDDGVWCLHGDLAIKPLPKFPGSFAGAASARMCVADGAAQFACVLTDAAVLPHAPSIKFNPLEGDFTLVDGLWTLKFQHSVSMLALLPWASAPLNGLFARQGTFTLSADGQGSWSNELLGLVPVKAGTADLEMWLRGPLSNSLSELKGQKPEGLSVAGLGYQAPHFDTADVVLTVDHLAMTARVDFFGFGDIVLFGRGLDLSTISGGGAWGTDTPVALECAFSQESQEWLEQTLATQLGFQFVMEGEPCLAAGFGDVTAQACGQAVAEGVQLFGRTGLPLKLEGTIVHGDYRLAIEDSKAAAFRVGA